MVGLRRFTQRRILVVTALSVIFLAACTTTPTGTTKDMFDMTSSTTGRGWFTIDGQVKAEYKAAAFAHFNQESLLEDMARGEGEYLNSMATLLDVPRERHAAFRSMAQNQYAEVARSSSGDPSIVLQSLVQVHP